MSSFGNDKADGQGRRGKGERKWEGMGVGVCGIFQKGKRKVFEETRGKNSNTHSCVVAFRPPLRKKKL